MATSPVTPPPGYALEPQTTPTLPPGYSIEGQPSDKPLPLGAVITPAPAGTAAAGADVQPSLKEKIAQFGPAVEQGVVGASALGTSLIGGSEISSGIKAGVKAATAPTVTTEAVGTGILDSAGEEIMREGIKYGPSALARVLAHPLGKVILQKASEGAIGVVSGASVWKALKLLGLF